MCSDFHGRYAFLECTDRVRYVEANVAYSRRSRPVSVADGDGVHHQANTYINRLAGLVMYGDGW